MLLVGSISVQDLARAVNEKRYLTPEEITLEKIVVIDQDPAPVSAPDNTTAN